MNLAKGFGKNYFTLNAITAVVSQVALNANLARINAFHLIKLSLEELNLEKQDEELPLLISQLKNVKPCHCNCYYSKCAKTTLLLNNSQNKYLNYFKTLNNSISPPLYINYHEKAN